jgi:hypothetical protein
MHRTTAPTLLAVFALACAKPKDEPAGTGAEAKAQPSSPGEEAASGAETPEAEIQPNTPPKAQIVRKDLLAKDLPEPPTLASLALTPAGAGVFAFAEGSDELAPRAAVALEGGLLLAGQAYLGRQPGKPPTSWRWLGFVPNEGEARSTKLESGAIRAASADAKGGALLAGVRGTGFDMRGWFASVDGQGQLGLQVDIEGTQAAEMFDLLPGARKGELALVAGYADAQAWFISLDAAGEQRWHKYVSSYGYTQARAVARLDGEAADILAVGTRSQGFGEAWWAKVPGDGGADPSPEGVEQDKLTITGADPNQMLRAIVDLGPAGYVALGTAKLNYIQDHDQVLAVGFDRAGTPSWSKVIPKLRVTDVFGGRADGEVARFVVGLPPAEPGGANGLGLVELRAGGESSAQSLAESGGWLSAGFVEGAEASELVVYAPTPQGVAWRRVPLQK